ncbi:MAG TPA: hypothetical protein VK539_21510 [Myxococcaceae bacterium]|nr:hypothetical protein [Myxococcaceae bacterium]
MRAIAILLCLATFAANAQSGGYRAPPEDSLTPPPITSAPRDEPAQPPPPAPAAPDEEFLPLPTTPPPASAQPSPPPAFTPPPPPPAEPRRVREPESTGPVEPPGNRARRYSRYSAGAGGSTLVLTAGLNGFVTGAMLGSAFNVSNDGSNSDGYTGAVIGGLTLGSAAILYQYFVPVGRREGLLVGGAATTALMSSLALASSGNMSSKDRALLTFTATNASIATVLLFTSGGEDVSSGDAGLVGATALYGFVITGLVEYIHARQTRQDFNFLPMLLAPTLGMAVGGLLALPLELSPRLVFELTTFPLLTGSAALLLGSRLADGVTTAKTVLVTMGGTFFLIGLINGLSAHAEESTQYSASSFQAVPMPVVMPAGRRNEGLAAGPGLFMRF